MSLKLFSKKEKKTESYFYSEGKWIPITEQRKLMDKASEMSSEKKYDKAKELLLRALEAKGDNPIDRHFIYNQLIDIFYKQRDEKIDALDKCIYYCQEDINRLTTFLEAWKKDYPHDINLPQCPSIIKLAIIFEKRGKIKEAIELCKFAIELRLNDGTKGGFEGRLKRLEKSQNL